MRDNWQTLLIWYNVGLTDGENAKQMTNVYGMPEKASMKKRLFAIAVQALEAEGWRVERERGSGKSSVRRITKDGHSKLVTIRTSQDTWIAFPRTFGDK